jgi:transcriptional regulator GlxA family with amidase domain
MSMTKGSGRFVWALPWVATLVAHGHPALAADSEPSRKGYTRRVAIVLYNGAEVLDFAGPTEVFEAASDFGSFRGQGAFAPYTVAASTIPITSQRVLKIVPEHTFADAPPPDILVIPGGDTSSLERDPAFVTWFREASKNAQVTLTVCTGAFVPGRLGLLDGLEVTTWYGAIPALRATAPKAVVQDGRRFVDNGSIVTTAGVSAGIDGALHTVARLLGRGVADRTARYMEYHWTPESYLAQRYSYLNPSLDGDGRLLQQAELDADTKSYAEASRVYHTLLERAPADAFVWYRLGKLLHQMGKWGEAIEAAGHALGSAEWRAEALYNMACAHALKGEPDSAMHRLREAVDAGFKKRWALEGDPDLASLRGSQSFQELLKRL